MHLEYDIKYIRSKRKIAKKISLHLIDETEELFKADPSNLKLNLKNIICKRDKYKQFIRVVGNSFLQNS